MRHQHWHEIEIDPRGRGETTGRLRLVLCLGPAHIAFETGAPVTVSFRGRGCGRDGKGIVGLSLGRAEARRANLVA